MTTLNSNQLPLFEDIYSATWNVEDGSDVVNITMNKEDGSVVGWVVEYDEEVGDWVEDDSLTEDDLKDIIIRFDLRCGPHHNRAIQF